MYLIHKALALKGLLSHHPAVTEVVTEATTEPVEGIGDVVLETRVAVLAKSAWWLAALRPNEFRMTL